MKSHCVPASSMSSSAYYWIISVHIFLSPWISCLIPSVFQSTTKAFFLHNRHKTMTCLYLNSRHLADVLKHSDLHCSAVSSCEITLNGTERWRGRGDSQMEGISVYALDKTCTQRHTWGHTHTLNWCLLYQSVYEIVLLFICCADDDTTHNNLINLQKEKLIQRISQLSALTCVAYITRLDTVGMLNKSHSSDQPFKHCSPEHTVLTLCCCRPLWTSTPHIKYKLSITHFSPSEPSSRHCSYFYI